MGHENGGWMNDDQRSSYLGLDDQRSRQEVELDQEAWAMQEAEARARVDAAIERLDAEGAEHQSDDELMCPACGRPYALHGIGCPALSADASPLDSLERTLAIAEEVGIGPGASPDPGDWPGGVPTDPRPYFAAHPPTAAEVEHGQNLAARTPTDPGPRFGDRLRGFLRELPDQGPGQAEGALITLEGRQIAALAAAIDQDAARAGYTWLDGPPWAAVTGDQDVEEFGDRMDLPPERRGPEPVFGARLQALGRSLELTGKDDADLRWVAEAINRDAAGLRQRVERQVEELRYAVQVSILWPTGLGPVKDVLDAEPFLDRLAGIFGPRQETRLVAPRQPEHGMTVGGLGDEP